MNNITLVSFSLRCHHRDTVSRIDIKNSYKIKMQLDVETLNITKKKMLFANFQ